MSIKDLFGKKKTKPVVRKTKEAIAVDAESLKTTTEKKKNENKFIPQLDYSRPSNFAFYGSAKKYYSDAFKTIAGTYPYDGSEEEVLKFRNELNYVEKYILDNLYPKTNGYALMSADGWGALSSTSGDYGLPASQEYIYVFGGPHSASSGMAEYSLKYSFSASNLYQKDIYSVIDENPAGRVGSRESNLKFDLVTGSAVEFWLKKDAFDISLTKKEVVFDLWNQSAITAPGYGRFLIELSGNNDWNSSPFFITALSGGGTGIDNTIIGQNITTGSLTSWRHYAFSFVNEGSNINVKFYVDGALNDEKTIGNALNPVTGALKAQIGALQYQIDNLGTGAPGSGKLSASIDEFRYWKSSRTSEQIGYNYFRPIKGGSNKRVSNATLGVYYKFNEGITGTSSIDSKVLDYSGRISNGQWVGYDSDSRSTESAIVLAGAYATEAKDPIIYSANTLVSELRTALEVTGTVHDTGNQNKIADLFPTWMRERAELSGDPTLDNLTQLMGVEFDKSFLLINRITELKKQNYFDDSEKAFPFIKEMLASYGLSVDDLLTAAKIDEQILNKNSTQIFDGDVSDVKNKIYQNLFNNLFFIYKSKGTEKAFRNILRSFGLNDELITINLYADSTTYTLEDNYRTKLLKANYLDKNHPDRFVGTVYQWHTSSNPNTISYISGSGEKALEDYLGFTAECKFILPFKPDITTANFFRTEFTASSIFGMNSAIQADQNDLGYPTNNYANFFVSAERLTVDSDTARFAINSLDPFPVPYLTTSYYNNIYRNSEWSIAVSIKPDNNIDNFVYGSTKTSSASTATDIPYVLEFYGINTIGERTLNEFYLTAAVDNTTAVNFLRDPKRLHLGARYENHTGTLKQQSDIQYDSLKYWNSHLGTGSVKQHMIDQQSYGRDESYEQINLYATGTLDTFIPKFETLILNWNFANLSSSDASGQFFVEDYSSGSTAAETYGTYKGYFNKQHAGEGKYFLASNTDMFKPTYLNSMKKQTPETTLASNLIQILRRDDDKYTKDDKVVKFSLHIEKGPYSAVNSEILNMFSTVLDFNNLIGEPVDRYRLDYKSLGKLRELMFARFENEVNVEKFISYYRWFDYAMGKVLKELIPASVKHEASLGTLIESHVLERNKYWTKFPTMEFKGTDPEAGMAGHEELTYNWKYGHAPARAPDRHTGHAPVLDKQAYNTMWWHQRANRGTSPLSSSVWGVNADKENVRIVVESFRSSSGGILAQPDKTVYRGRKTALRRFTKPYKFSMNVHKVIHGGINFNKNKNVHFAYNAVAPAGPVEHSGSFVPVNVLLSLESDMYPRPDNKDVLDPNKKEKVFAKVVHGRDYEGGTGYATTDMNFAFPFNVMRSTVSGGYNDLVNIGYQTGTIITNLHTDAYGPDLEIPMQGPFTDQWVGGLQARHIDLNKMGPNNTLDNYTTRPEAWKLLLDTCTTNSGAIGLVGADYPWPEANASGAMPYPMTASQKANRFRDEFAKRPLNIRNIPYSTASARLGNYRFNYEVVSSVGATQNPRAFLRDTPVLPFQVSPGSNAKSLLTRDSAGANASDGETVTLSDGVVTKTLTFKTTPTQPDHVLIGTNSFNSYLHLVQNINLSHSWGLRCDIALDGTGNFAWLTNIYYQGDFTNTTVSTTWASLKIGDMSGSANIAKTADITNVLTYRNIHRGQDGHMYTTGTTRYENPHTGDIYQEYFATPKYDYDYSVGYLTGNASRPNQTIVRSQFAAPGGIEVMTPGYRNFRADEMSVYNTIPYRNLTVRRPEQATHGIVPEITGAGGPGIRVFDTIGMDFGIGAHLARHSARFGRDSLIFPPTQYRREYSLTSSFIGYSEKAVYRKAGSLQGWWRLRDNMTANGLSSVVDSSGKGHTNAFASLKDRPHSYSTSSSPSPYINTSGSNLTYRFTEDDEAKYPIGSAATWDAIIGNNTAGGSTEKMTLAAWILPINTGSTIARIMDFGDNDLRLYTDTTDRKLKFGARWGDREAVIWSTPTGSLAFSFTGSGGALRNNRWQHVAVTFDAAGSLMPGTPRMYIDGEEQVVAKTYGVEPTASYYGIVSQDCYIGNDAGGDNMFTGEINDAAIWNTLLEGEDIKAIYNAAKIPGPSPPPGILYHEWLPDFTTPLGNYASTLYGQGPGHSYTESPSLHKINRNPIPKMNCTELDGQVEVITDPWYGGYGMKWPDFNFNNIMGYVLVPSSLDLRKRMMCDSGSIFTASMNQTEEDNVTGPGAFTISVWLKINRTNQLTLTSHSGTIYSAGLTSGGPAGDETSDHGDRPGHGTGLGVGIYNVSGTLHTGSKPYFEVTYHASPEGMAFRTAGITKAAFGPYNSPAGDFTRYYQHYVWTKPTSWVDEGWNHLVVVSPSCSNGMLDHNAASIYVNGISQSADIIGSRAPYYAGGQSSLTASQTGIGAFPQVRNWGGTKVTGPNNSYLCNSLIMIGGSTSGSGDINEGSDFSEHAPGVTHQFTGSMSEFAFFTHFRSSPFESATGAPDARQVLELYNEGKAFDLRKSSMVTSSNGTVLEAWWRFMQVDDWLPNNQIQPPATNTFTASGDSRRIIGTSSGGGGVGSHPTPGEPLPETELYLIPLAAVTGAAYTAVLGGFFIEGTNPSKISSSAGTFSVEADGRPAKATLTVNYDHTTCPSLEIFSSGSGESPPGRPGGLRTMIIEDYSGNGITLVGDLSLANAMRTCTARSVAAAPCYNRQGDDIDTYAFGLGGNSTAAITSSNQIAQKIDEALKLAISSGSLKMRSTVDGNVVTMYQRAAGTQGNTVIKSWFSTSSCGLAVEGFSGGTDYNRSLNCPEQKQYDNYYVQHPIPRTDVQYSWITASFTGSATSSIRMGYAPFDTWDDGLDNNGENPYEALLSASVVNEYYESNNRIVLHATNNYWYNESRGNRKEGKTDPEINFKNWGDAYAPYGGFGPYAISAGIKITSFDMGYQVGTNTISPSRFLPKYYNDFGLLSSLATWPNQDDISTLPWQTTQSVVYGDKGTVNRYENDLIGTGSRIDQWTERFNLYITRLNGPYGATTFNFLRNKDNLNIRANRKHNIYTAVASPGPSSPDNASVWSRFGPIRRFEKVSPVTSKYGNLIYTFNISEILTNTFGQSYEKDVNISMRSTFGNQRVYFNNNELNKFVGLNAHCDTVVYDKFKELYLHGGLESELSPMKDLVSIRYSEVVYPTSLNMYSTAARKRPNVVGFWRNTIEKRRVTPNWSMVGPRYVDRITDYVYEIPNVTTGSWSVPFTGSSLTFTEIKASRWVLDTGADYSTGSYESMALSWSAGHFPDGPSSIWTDGWALSSSHAAFWQTGSGPDGDILSPLVDPDKVAGGGLLFNNVTHYHGYGMCAVSASSDQTLGGPFYMGTMQAAMGYYFITASCLYALKQATAHSSSIYAWNRPGIVEYPPLAATSPITASKFPQNYLTGTRDAFRVKGFGDWWDTPQMAGYYDSGSNWISSSMNPFYDTYEDFNLELRTKNKDMTILPEFRMSAHIERFAAGDGTLSTEIDDLFDIPEARVVGTDERTMTITKGPINSSTSSFYKVYSTSDFLENFEVIKKDHEDLIDPTELTLRCKVIKKFMPYEGFYPAQRTVQLYEQFMKSYASTISGSGTWVGQNLIPRPVLTPLFAPGIMFNSIKSGIAVDFPVIEVRGSGSFDTWRPVAGLVPTQPDNWAGLEACRQHKNGALDNNTLTASFTADRFAGARYIQNTGLDYSEPGDPRVTVVDRYIQLVGSNRPGTCQFDYRVPFEAILEPSEFLADRPIYDMFVNDQTAIFNTYSSSYGFPYFLQGQQNFTWSKLNTPKAQIGEANDPLYTLMAQNFFGSVPDFFLDQGEMATISSKKQSELNLNLVQGDIYGARIRMRRTMNMPRSWATDADQFGWLRAPGRSSSGTASAGAPSWVPWTSPFPVGKIDAPLQAVEYNLPQDPVRQPGLYETLTMYDRPSAFGPPASGRYQLESNLKYCLDPSGSRVAGARGRYPATSGTMDYGDRIAFGSRPSVKGPLNREITGSWGSSTENVSSSIEGPLGGANTSQFACKDAREGFYPAFTPPYYDGQAWLDIIFTVPTTKEYTLAEIITNSKTQSWRFDPGWLYRSGQYNGNAVHPSASFSIIPGSVYYSQTDGNHAGVTGTLGPSEKPFPWRNGAAPYNGNHINFNAMQIEASVNYDLVATLPSTTVDNEGNLVVRDIATENDKMWVVQPKWETPILNFKGLRRGSDGILGNKGINACKSTGMWHTYGRIPQAREGVYLEIIDMPKKWMNGHWSLKKNMNLGYDDPMYGSLPASDKINAAPGWNTPYTASAYDDISRASEVKSLRDLVGFRNSSHASNAIVSSRDLKPKVRLGELADTKIVSEAIVAIPFVEKEGEKYFFEIERYLVQSALSGRPIITLPQPGDSIEDMLEKMDRYVLPPTMDFITYPEITPFAMYIFEFTHEFDRVDLANIWQNIAPRTSRKFEIAEATLSHPILSNELMGYALTKSDESFMKDVRWLVFKAKQKAPDSYEDKVAGKTPPKLQFTKMSSMRVIPRFNKFRMRRARFSNNALKLKTATITPSFKIGRALSEPETDVKLSYNWPYDYFSIIECANMTAEIEFGPKAQPPTLQPMSPKTNLDVTGRTAENIPQASADLGARAATFVPKAKISGARRVRSGLFNKPRGVFKPSSGGKGPKGPLNSN